MDKQKTRLGLSKQDRDNMRLYGERKKWEQRLHALSLASKYIENGTEKEIRSKIAQWRNHAQEAATTLLPYYRDLHDPYQSESSGSMDDMTAMLTTIGIDPNCIGYSAHLGDFTE